MNQKIRYIKNFSRHLFNADQVVALEAAGYIADEEGARAPFFTSAADFAEKVGGCIAAAVLPGDILRDCWAGEATIPDGTILVGWRTDVAARKRGRFAVRGIVAHEWRDGAPVRILNEEIMPTVENDFGTGAEFNYGTPKERKR